MLLALAGLLPAQRMHHFDIRKMNLGFTMGLAVAGYDMTDQINQTDPATGWVLKSVDVVRKPGIYLGLISSLKLSNNFDFRFLPSVSLEERDFIFHMDSTINLSPPIVRKKIETSNLNMPFLIKFKSNYYKRTRLFLQMGIQPSFNLSSNRKVKNDPDLLKTQGFDVAYVASFGIDLYGERLKLSPEIRFTRGMRNLYVNDRTRFPFAISDLFSQLLVFNINFE
jgi:hypothetical protein